MDPGILQNCDKHGAGPPTVVTLRTNGRCFKTGADIKAFTNSVRKAIGRSSWVADLTMRILMPIPGTTRAASVRSLEHNYTMCFWRTSHPNASQCWDDCQMSERHAAPSPKYWVVTFQVKSVIIQLLINTQRDKLVSWTQLKSTF